jgi:hypothetical protein
LNNSGSQQVAKKSKKLSKALKIKRPIKRHGNKRQETSEGVKGLPGIYSTHLITKLANKFA